MNCLLFQRGIFLLLIVDFLGHVAINNPEIAKTNARACTTPKCSPMSIPVRVANIGISVVKTPADAAGTFFKPTIHDQTQITLEESA